MGNLPVALTRLIGRDRAVSELSALLWGTRLLTLCGPGGVGKTRLAIAVAEATRADFLDGAWWVDLASTFEAALVPQAVISAVMPGEPASESVAGVLARRFTEPSLLVLDNCEQVIEGCARLVTEMLSRAPAIRIIATSRQPLGVPGEQVWRVPGLEVSEPGAHPAGGAPEDAVDLFVERARAAASGFDPDAPRVREAARRVCRQLDGLPLAVELAAARVSLLGVEQIAERLGRDTGFLRHASRSAPERHRTLRQTVDWSHRLLAPAEQVLFRRLAAFRDTFTLEAAEAVCSDAKLPAEGVLDGLGGLVDQSLAQVIDDQAHRRYRLPETVRQVAAEKLAESGEHDPMRDRHAEHFVALADDAQVTQAGAEQVRWLERLDLERANLREALEWLLDRDPGRAAGLAARLWPFWYQRGFYGEARQWFERVLAATADLPGAARADLMLKGGEVAFLQCDYSIATSRLEAALTLIDQLSDEAMIAVARQRLGSIAREQGRYDEARRFHEESLAIWTRLADGHGVASARNYLGFVAWLTGDCSATEALCSQALAEFRRTGSLENVAGTLVNLGAAALYRGELASAAERFEEALSVSRRLGFQEGIAWSLHELAIVARRRRGQPNEQARMLRDALLIHHQLGDRWRMASLLEEMAGSLVVRRDPSTAVSLMAFAHALREQLGMPVPPVEQPDLVGALRRAESRLGRGQIETARSAGRKWQLDEAVDAALRAADEVAGAAGEATIDPNPILTSRELAVLALLSRGYSNREIAADLYISPSTAGVHVSNILRKLGAKRRADAARLAHALGLLPVA